MIGCPKSTRRKQLLRSHQEYYEGDDSNNTLLPLLFVNKRNAQTGGFPAGALRLSKCKGLPPEATLRTACRERL